MTSRIAVGVVLALCGGFPAFAQEPVVVKPILSTVPLNNYEDAPATPDADDPAIWVNRHRPAQSLVVGTAKDAGLLVYDLNGVLVQALLPPNAPQVLDGDPPTPAGVNPAANRPCPDSESGETFGRYNNVDIAYDVSLGHGRNAKRVDVAIVSDRGCDRVRFFEIDPSDPNGPLVDITSPDAPRVFPRRFDQPSPFQPSGGDAGWQVNPVDDQNTVYGLTVASDRNEVFVSQRERGLVKQLQIYPAGDGTLTYSVKRTFLFDTVFDLKDKAGSSYLWTPCREAVQEEPQSEGVLFDAVNETLYVAFETIGLYRIPLGPSVPRFAIVRRNQLIEPVTSFGQAYVAKPDDDEFECEYNGTPETDDIVVEGSDVQAGEFVEADFEGLTLVASRPGQTLLLASSQGDSSFHFYRIRGTHPQHLGSFRIEGVGDTDGVHYVPVPLSKEYPLGLLVVQNGEAPEPDDTSPINGYEFDGATQFMYVNFLHTLGALVSPEGTGSHQSFW